MITLDDLKRICTTTKSGRLALFVAWTILAVLAGAWIS